MIQQEESGSLYDFVDSNHTAPVIEQKAPLVREVNWQASNNERFKRDLPDHVKDAMAVEVVDRSYYAFEDLVWNRNPRDSFTDKVNREFGGKPTGDFSFRDEKARYIKLYKSMMQEI